jgi:hypothetical protein
MSRIACAQRKSTGSFAVDNSSDNLYFNAGNFGSDNNSFVKTPLVMNSGIVNTNFGNWCENNSKFTFTEKGMYVISGTFTLSSFSFSKSNINTVTSKAYITMALEKEHLVLAKLNCKDRNEVETCTNSFSVPVVITQDNQTLSFFGCRTPFISYERSDFLGLGVCDVIGNGVIPIANFIRIHKSGLNELS